jgi:hypothetical protein
MADTPSNSKSVIDRATVMVALLTSFAGAIIAIMNAAYYLADRRHEQDKQTFDNQITIAKTYFDTFTKLEAGKFCDRQGDALLFGRTSLELANLDEGDVVAELESASSNSRRADQNHTGIAAVAVLMYSDIIRRTKSECDHSAISAPPPGKPGVVVEATNVGAQSPSSYDLQQKAAASMAPVSKQFTVWIQYAAGTADQVRAAAIQSKLLGSGDYKVPGLQAVTAVPSHDQIRIFHGGDADVARKVASVTGLDESQIVSLEKAYPNLPKGVLEIWLKR